MATEAQATSGDNSEPTEFLKHLRSIHFVMILTSLVIIIAINSSDKLYRQANEQLSDLLSIEEDLTKERILAYLKKMPAAKDNFEQNAYSSDLLTGLEDELGQYQADLGEVESVSLIMDFDMNTDFIDDGDLIAEKGLLLLRKDLTITPFLWDWRGLVTTTIDELESSFNTINAYETVLDYDYFQSTFVVKYFVDKGIAATPISENEYVAILEQYGVTELYGVVKQFIPTTAEERERLLADLPALDVSPEALNFEEYQPDYVVLRLQNKSYYSNADFEAEIHFPIILSPVSFNLVSDLLKDKFPDKPYYASHKSGSRSFKALFPELYTATQHLKTTQIKEITSYLLAQQKQEDAPVEIIGLKLSSELIEVWGILLLVAIQLYFAIHYQNFNRMPLWPTVAFPWIGIYSGLLPVLTFLGSVILPTATCGYVLFLKYRETETLSVLNVVFFVVSVLCLVVTIVNYIKRQRDMANPITQNL